MTEYGVLVTQSGSLHRRHNPARKGLWLRSVVAGYSVLAIRLASKAQPNNKKQTIAIGHERQRR